LSPSFPSFFQGITFIHHPQWEATKSESTNYDTEEAQKEAQPYLQPNEDSASNTAKINFPVGIEHAVDCYNIK
jgi:hypothetical protein